MSLRSIVLGCCLLAGAYSLSACGDDDGGDDTGGGDAGGGAGRDGNAGSGSAGRSGSGGGTAGSGSGGSGAGTGDNRQLADLSASEAEDLCEELGAELAGTVDTDDAERLGCTLLALFTSVSGGEDAVDRAACEQSVTDCLATGLGEGTTEMTCDAERLQTASIGCETTVGEYSECLSASVEQIGMAIDAFTCETLSDPDTASEALGMMGSAPECAGVEQDCPALLEGGGSSGEPSESGCDDTCSDAEDGFCDDGGPNSDFNLCGLGTDCSDCGPR